MTLKRDRVVVVDLEASCWKNHQNPPGEQSEIIEIGVCWLDLQSGEPSGKMSILVKPTRSKVSEFCTNLTGLTQEKLDAEGVAFDAACEQLQARYDTQNHLWVSWGAYDERMFRQQCESFVVPYPFSPHHLNLKQCYADLNRLDRRVGMARALKMEEMNMDGTHHRGSDDAWNTARLLARTMTKHGTDFLWL